MEKRKMAQQVHIPGKALVLAGLFLAGLVLAGGKAVFGMFPFGLAVASSASGFLGAAAVFLGSLFGAAGVGGVMPLVMTGVFILRAGISMWLAADEDSFPLRRRKKSARNPRRQKETILRHSRTSGWIRTMVRHRSENIKIPGEEEGEQAAGETAERSGDMSAMQSAEPGSIPKRRKVLPDARLSGTGAAVIGGKYAGRRTAVSRGELAALVKWADRKLFMEHISLRMALSALASLTAGAFSLVYGGYLTYDLWGAVFSVFVSPLCTYLFYAAHDRHMRTSAFREPGILASLALLCYCLSGTTLPLLGFNLGEGAALAAAVLTGGSFGVTRGALVGLTCGLFLEPVYAPAFALAGAVTGAFSARYSESVFALGQGYSRAFGLFAGSTAAVIWAVYSGGFTGLA